ncbi:nucleotidyltransferase domain-containing protein [Orenia marismortui]|uniref:nucleotidyltransferase domain-containing protein n=1 Tax=Orenia marismortui TaxID=46469 RepID=UPI000369FAA4|nr:nucleotidyltransferase domain-containing protein [Orenia marismortui]
MYNRIISKLRDIEEENNIRILYAVEAGSRAWGFSSETSDYDIRFIYVHPIEWYLSIEEKEDYIDLQINNSIDLHGWDLQKTLKLFRKSNPSILEWLHSSSIYIENSTLIDRLRRLSRDYFSPKALLYHYLNMAKANYKKYLGENKINLKKYLYIIMPLLACSYIKNKKKIPVMNFYNLMNSELNNSLLLEEISSLLIQKKSDKYNKEILRLDIIDDFLETQINYYQEYVLKVEGKDPIDYNCLDKLFQKSLEEIWRLSL